MQRRTAAAVLVGFVVLLAGCAGGSGPGGDGVTTTAGGDHSLVENRTAALRDAGSYTAVWEMEFRGDGEAATTTRYTHAVNYDDERAAFTMTVVEGGTDASDYETYQADGSLHTRYGTGEEATYSVVEAPFAPGNTLFPVRGYVTDGDALDEFTAAGTETFDGATVTRYERTDRPTWVTGGAAGGESTWQEFTYTVLVDRDGLVRSEGWSATGETDEGATERVTFTYSLTNVGATTVEEPDWAATARAQSA